MARPSDLDRIICRVATLEEIRDESGDLDAIALQSDEVHRSQSISHPNRRAQFLAGRWLTRQLLCEALGGMPSEWRITVDAAHKPRIVGRNDLHFSISHSKNLIGCAIAAQSIGLDIERIDASRDVAELSKMIDVAGIEGLAGRDDAQRFTIAWTLKEACMKQTGKPFDIASMKGMRLVVSPPKDANVASWVDSTRFAMSIATEHVSVTHLRWISPPQVPLASYYKLLSARAIP